MTFTKQNLLQINATVIAGILILVSIQSINSIAPRDMLLDGLIHVRAGELDLKTADDFRDALKEKNFVLSDEQSKIILALEYEKNLSSSY